jgi:hypothetical protein
LFAAIKWLDPNKFLLEETLRFSFAKNTLFFTLIVQRVFSFSRTAFSFLFCLDFCSDLVLSLHQGIFGPLVYVGIHQKCCFKKVWMVLEKRKSFMQKSGTKRSLFTLIVCLVIFAVVWLVSNEWDCLMSLWKKSCVVLLYGSIYLVFSFDALFGLTWLMLTTCLTLTKSP